MDIDEFKRILSDITRDDELGELCDMHLLHGTPYIFSGEENAYFCFRKRLAHQFDVAFYEVLIIGSSKLGFSPHKCTKFSLDSDVDVALVSQKLFDKYLGYVGELQYALRSKNLTLSERDYREYHKFLEYTAIGWIRPDKLPYKLHVKQIKTDWFDYFGSISNGRSEIGNYKATGAIFRSFGHLQKYLISGLKSAQQAIKVGAQA